MIEISRDAGTGGFKTRPYILCDAGTGGFETRPYILCDAGRGEFTPLTTAPYARGSFGIGIGLIA